MHSKGTGKNPDRRTALRAVSLQLNERSSANFEDYDYCLRGLKVLEELSINVRCHRDFFLLTGRV